MKIILILGILFQVLIVQSQEFDESFIESLPDDIKEDIMNRSDQQSESFEDNYRASEYSSRLQQAEELIDPIIQIFAVNLNILNISNGMVGVEYNS